MFSANTELQVADADFQSIKNSIKTFIKNKTEFSDYDFEGATISYLLDILSYNTHLNSFYVNMAINESYLDTSQIRSTTVSNAKKLGYVPKSAKSAMTSMTIGFMPNDTPTQIRIPKGSKFTAKKNGIQYNFVTTQDNIAVPVGNGLYTKTIDVYEGTYLTQTYEYNDSKKFYEILESSIDVSTLKVGIKPNNLSSDITYWERVDNILIAQSDSQVYYLQENSSEKFEIYFGDGVLGQSLQNGNVIVMTYIATNGKEANDISTLKPVGYVGEDISNPTKKYEAYNVTTHYKTRNGNPKEIINSIKSNAPNFYAAQNRLVTAPDYENFVVSNYPFVQSCNAWGGEEHNPPVYGRVLISIKPTGGYALQQVTKDSIVTDMKRKNVLAIEPFIIDPTFVFIRPTMNVYYDSNRTIKSGQDIYNSVTTAIQTYEKTNLSTFGKSFRYSNFIRAVDLADNAIVGNDTDVDLEKRLVPTYNSSVSYRLNFDTALKYPYEGYFGAFRSSQFRTNTTTNVLNLEDDGLGIVRSVYYVGDTKVVFRNVGTIDYDTGIIDINEIYVTQLFSTIDTELKFYVQPSERNYTQRKNQILLLSTPNLFIRDINTKQIVSSGVVDVQGNYSPIFNNGLNNTRIVV